KKKNIFFSTHKQCFEIWFGVGAPPPPPNTVTKKITLQHYLFLKVAIRTTFKNISGVSVSPMRCTFGK
ncbi:MAG: hypothetical protein ACK5NP_06880, partial [Pseudanabaena sp.]